MLMPKADDTVTSDTARGQQYKAKEGPSRAQPAVSSCLAPDEFFVYVEGCPEPAMREGILLHLDVCEICRVLMAEAARVVMAADSNGSGHTFRVLADREIVGGRYEVCRFIARGGMGEVYEATDTALKERVALKTLAVTTSDRGDAAEGLLHEVRLARKVSHPNVCRILELGVHHGAGATAVPFLTMEFLTGETLAQRLARLGPLPSATVLEIVGGLAAGLTAVHQAGIVHRDLKSENVFLASNGDGTERTVVMDFGLARIFDTNSIRRSTNGRFMIGTPAYMAPEQLAGQPATPASDTYALGIVTFEMLTGRLPFEGESLTTVALSRSQQTPRSILSVLPHLDFRWDTLIRQCLQGNPEKRLRSVVEFSKAIEDIRKSPPIRRGRWARAGLFGFLAVLGLAIALVPTTRPTRLPPGRTAINVPRRAHPASQVILRRFSNPPTAEPVRIDAAASKSARGAVPVTVRRVKGSATVPGAPGPTQRGEPDRDNAKYVTNEEQAVDVLEAHSSGHDLTRERVKSSPPGPANDPFVPAPSARSPHPDDLVDPF